MYLRMEISFFDPNLLCFHSINDIQGGGNGSFDWSCQGLLSFEQKMMRIKYKFYALWF